VRKAALLAIVVIAAGCSRRPASAAPPTSAPSDAVLSYEAQQGQAVYRHYCLTCHGETGAGDGFNAFNLDPHPRDLSDPVFQKGKTDADLKEAVKRGGSAVGLSPLMPPWGRTLSARQVDDVVLYLRTLRRKS
jgi:mono/diheme cytochrome c family protein